MYDPFARPFSFQSTGFGFVLLRVALYIAVYWYYCCFCGRWMWDKIGRSTPASNQPIVCRPTQWTTRWGDSHSILLAIALASLWRYPLLERWGGGEAEALIPFARWKLYWKISPDGAPSGPRGKIDLILLMHFMARFPVAKGIYCCTGAWDGADSLEPRDSVECEHSSILYSNGRPEWILL